MNAEALSGEIACGGDLEPAKRMASSPLDSASILGERFATPETAPRCWTLLRRYFPTPILETIELFLWIVR
jgi:hypothetical protein